MDSVDVQNNTGSAAILISSGSGKAKVHYTSYPCDGTAYMDLYTPGNPALEPRVVAHENGHLFGCLYDEYNDVAGTPSHCGHSIMGNFFASPNNQNLCYCDNWNGSVCAVNAGDHNRDGNATPNPIRPPAWNAITTAPYVNVPTQTPDNYNYENFYFNFLMANIL